MTFTKMASNSSNNKPKKLPKVKVIKHYIFKIADMNTILVFFKVQNNNNKFLLCI